MLQMKGAGWRMGFPSLVVALVLLLSLEVSLADPVRPNVVLIVVDALRPDHLGCFGYERPTSPNIDRLAAYGIVFETAITQASYTRASFPSFLTSLYPFQHGVTHWEAVLPDELVTLPEALRASGYYSVAIVHRLVLSERFRILRGFDMELGMFPGARGAHKLSQAAIEAIGDAPEPFFLMLHLFDAHKPYMVSDDYVDVVRGDSQVKPYRWKAKEYIGTYDLPSEEQLEGEILLYDACIRYADEAIGRVVAHLEDTGIADHTLVIVTADHGESFWEHKLPMHSTNVYDEAIRVPLIFTYPGRFDRPMRIPDQVRLIDLFPTLVDVTGGVIPRQCEGVSLLGLLEGGKMEHRQGTFLPADVALCECPTPRALATRCLRTTGWKMIVESVTSTVELYNLVDDPGETSNLWGRGTAYEDTLISIIQRIPGVPLRGWRVGFTGGKEGPRFETRIDLPYGGRFSVIESITGHTKASLQVGADSTSCVFSTDAHGLELLLLDTKPATVPVRFEIGSPGRTLDAVFTGMTGERAPDEAFVLDTETGLGTPEVFQKSRRSGTPGAHIWWLPGKEMAKRGITSELTPEEIKRLRALGYIQ